jgi:hypothetical protein
LPTVHFVLDHLDFAGSADRFRRNINALELLPALEGNGRAASADERRVLGHYSAFGESASLDRLFQWSPATGRFTVQPRYAALLGDADARSLRRAALTAFYTPLDVVRAIWQATELLGILRLDRPRIIEPALGVGHFISAMPPALRSRPAMLAGLEPVAGDGLASGAPAPADSAAITVDASRLGPELLALEIVPPRTSDLPHAAWREVPVFAARGDSAPPSVLGVQLAFC